MDVMKFLYLINGLGFSNNTGIGGSDKRAIEIIRNIKNEDPEGKYDILTTSSGKKLFVKAEKLKTKYYSINQPNWWPNELNKHLVGRILSYFYATFVSVFWIDKFKKYDAYFASSDFFFDIIPGYIFKLVYKKPLICMIHHYIVSPESRQGSRLLNTLLYYSQRFSFWFISSTADVLFLYDTQEGKNISKILFGNKPKVDIHYVQNGINKLVLDQAKQKKKIYEAGFLGGLRASKGIAQFVPMWKLVMEKFPNARFVVIGGGSSEIVHDLKQEIEKAGLQDNIILTGPLSGPQLFEKLKQAKLFLFPSHEEGWGIALCEAMYCRLPIICYSLPAFKTFGNEIDSFKKGNYKKLANKTIEYLENESKIPPKGEKMKEIALKYTWERIAVNEKKIFEEILAKYS